LPCRAESEAVSHWKGQIVSLLLLHQFFPIEGCGKDGEVRVAFTVDRAGKLISSNIVSGTGFPALDKAALEIIKRTQPFPPAPAEITGDQFKLVAPIIFHKPDRPISCEAVRRAEKLRSIYSNSICRGC
jgi:protein TonB